MWEVCWSVRDLLSACSLFVRLCGKGNKMAEYYDFTHTIAQHLDRHLIVPLLEYLGNKDV